MVLKRVRDLDFFRSLRFYLDLWKGKIENGF